MTGSRGEVDGTTSDYGTGSGLRHGCTHYSPRHEGSRPYRVLGVIVSFAHPSTRQRAGGVTVLYEFTNELARRGHEVHFVHAPALSNRVDSVEEIPFCFHPDVRHHFVDTPDDRSLPDGDVRFGPGTARQGHHVVLAQGFRLIGPRMDRAAFRALAPKVCVASWLLEVGRTFGVHSEQLVHVPPGIDHEMFSVRIAPDDRDVDLALLYHAHGEKGWVVGYEVLQEVARRRPDLRAIVFSMAGRPPQPLPDGVEVHLDLDQRSLADRVYNRTRVMLQASHHEGFGLTAVEAMACGAALVTTDCGGSRDYAFPGETARVRRAGDVVGLADDVEALLDDEAQRRALASRGEQLVRRFRWERSGELLEAFLEQYLADPERYQRPPSEDRSEEFRL
jgi:glycosyltransferase involved in cell wall biosynthesis